MVGVSSKKLFLSRHMCVVAPLSTHHTSSLLVNFAQRVLTEDDVNVTISSAAAWVCSDAIETCFSFAIFVQQSAALSGTPASLSCGSMNLSSLSRDHRRHHHQPHPQSPSMTATSSPTHTADIHDFDTRDFVVAPTLTPSPPLTTSLSPGTSVTSSPQHFYPRSTNTGSGHPNTDDEEQEYSTSNNLQSPYHHRSTGQQTCTHRITTSPIQTIVTIPPVTTTPPPSETNILTNSNTSNAFKTNFNSRYDWQRSASCKNLRTENKLYYGSEKNVDTPSPYNDSTRGYYDSIYRQERLLDAPVTRYDDSRRVCYSAAGSKTNSVDRGSDAVPDTKIYSSSYPGTTSSLSTESGGADEPGMMEGGSDCILIGAGDTGSQEDILFSNDDLSHDSYELLEREQDEDADGDDEREMEGELNRRVKIYSATRTCSIDSSGDNLPLDDIIEESRKRIGRSPETEGVFFMDSDEVELTGSSHSYIKAVDSRRHLNIEVADKGIGSIDYRDVVDSRRQVNTADKGIGSIDYREDYMIRDESSYVQVPLVTEVKRDVTKSGTLHVYQSEEQFVITNMQSPVNVEINKFGFDKIQDIKPQLKSQDFQTSLEDSKEISENNAQTHFSEYNVKCEPGLVIGFHDKDDISRSNTSLHAHALGERAHSDSHSCVRQGPGLSKRRTLTHQKSIDLTPAESGEIGGVGEVSESVLDLTTVGMTCTSELNIPYTLHKRHAMNGTVPSVGASQSCKDLGALASSEQSAESLEQQKVMLSDLHKIKDLNLRKPISVEIKSQEILVNKVCSESSTKEGKYSKDLKSSWEDISSDYVANVFDKGALDNVRAFGFEEFSLKGFSGFEQVSEQAHKAKDFDCDKENKLMMGVSREIKPFEEMVGRNNVKTREIYSSEVDVRNVSYQEENKSCTNSLKDGSMLNDRNKIKSPVGSVDKEKEINRISGKNEIKTPTSSLDKEKEILVSGDRIRIKTPVTSIEREKEIVGNKHITPVSSIDKDNEIKGDKKKMKSPISNSERNKEIIGDKKKLKTPISSFDREKETITDKKKLKTPISSFDKEKEIKGDKKKLKTPISSFDKEKEIVADKKKLKTPINSFDREKEIAGERRKIKTPLSSFDREKEIVGDKKKIKTPVSSFDREKEIIGEKKKIRTPVSSFDKEKGIIVIGEKKRVKTPVSSFDKDKEFIVIDGKKSWRTPVSSFDKEKEMGIGEKKRIRTPVSSIDKETEIIVIDSEEEMNNIVSSFDEERGIIVISEEKTKPTANRDVISNNDQYFLRRISAMTSSDDELNKIAITSSDEEMKRVITSSDEEMKRVITSSDEEMKRVITSSDEEMKRVITSSDEEMKRVITSSDEEIKRVITSSDEEIKRVITSSDDEKVMSFDPHTESKKETVINSDEERKQTVFSSSDDEKKKPDTTKISSWEQEFPTAPLIPRKRDRSPILFARLGLSEGSAFSPVHSSPTSSKRAKSLDAPVVSVHHLPPAYAFSSKDDTLDNSDDSCGKGAKHISSSKQPGGNGAVTKTATPKLGDKALLRKIPSTIVDEDFIEDCTLKVDEQPILYKSVSSERFIEVTAAGKRSPEITGSKVITLNKDDGAVSPSTDVSTDTDMQPQSETAKQALNIKSLVKESPRLLSPRLETQISRASSSPVSPSRSPLHGLEEKVSTLHHFFGNKVKKFIEEASSTESSINIDDGQEPQLNLENIVKKDLLPNDSFEYTTERSAFLLRDTGSSGDYQTFDEIDLPIEFKDEPQRSIELMAKLEVPEDLSGNESASNKSMQEEIEDSDILSVEKKETDTLTPQDEVGSPEQWASAEDMREKLPPGEFETNTRDAVRKIPEVLSDYDNLSPPPTFQEEDFETPVVPEREFVEIQLVEEDFDKITSRIKEDILEEVKEDEFDIEFPRSRKEVPVLTQDSDGNWIIQECTQPQENVKLEQDLDKKGESSPETPKDDKSSVERTKSEEEASSSSSLNLPAKKELSSTWRPFLLESSGSSSLEEGFFPPDDSAHLADEEEISSNSNNRDDTFHDDVIDFPTGFGYPCIGSSIGMSGADMIIGGYGGTFALSRTLSRISERSTTSEQERSDLDDDSTKPSSQSPSVDDESLLSSDHQPSLSSDPPSGSAQQPEAKGEESPRVVPMELPVGTSATAPGSLIPPPVPLLSDDDWPSPPTSSSMFETPVVSHVETFYMEIHPEEACKVMVLDSTDPTGEDGSSTDENHTLHDEDDDFMSGFGDDCLSSSAATLDGTVKMVVRPKCPSHYCTGSSLSEDTSMGLSLSEWSSSTGTVRQQCRLHYSSTKSDDTSLDELGPSLSDMGTCVKSSIRSKSPSYYSGAKSDTCLDETSPTRLGKPSNPKNHSYYTASKSLTNVGTSLDDGPAPIMSSERPVKVTRPKVTPYYSSSSSLRETRSLSETRRCRSHLSDQKLSQDGRIESSPTSQVYAEELGYPSQPQGTERSVKMPVKTKGYSYYSVAKSPPSDGGSSSSLDGSNTVERAPRVPKRKKSQPKRRHRVTVEMEVRDGHIVEVPTAPTQSVTVDTHSLSSDFSEHSPSTHSSESNIFVPKQSSV
uniref:Uncharacterized protein n=1 Tax=Timema shepardi TaxID=629360 RepID=A0A7R9AVV8_TIMSH|nr:unnamed protein product [Timema shepardi]